MRLKVGETTPGGLAIRATISDESHRMGGRPVGGPYHHTAGSGTGPSVMRSVQSINAARALRSALVGTTWNVALMPQLGNSMISTWSEWKRYPRAGRGENLEAPISPG